MGRNLSLLAHLPRFEADGVTHRRDCECVRCDAGYRPSETDRTVAGQRWEERRIREAAARALARRQERARVRAVATELALGVEIRAANEEVRALRAAHARADGDPTARAPAGAAANGDAARRGAGGGGAPVGPAGFEPAANGLKVRRPEPVAAGVVSRGPAHGETPCSATSQRAAARPSAAATYEPEAPDELELVCIVCHGDVGRTEKVVYWPPTADPRRGDRALPAASTKRGRCDLRAGQRRRDVLGRRLGLHQAGAWGNAPARTYRERARAALERGPGVARAAADALGLDVGADSPARRPGAQRERGRALSAARADPGAGERL